MNKINVIAFYIFLIFINTAVQATTTITTGISANTLRDLLFVDQSNISNLSNATLVGLAEQSGKFPETNLGPILGNDVLLTHPGIILSTGDRTNGSNQNLAQPGDIAIENELRTNVISNIPNASTHDANSLSFTFEVAPGINSISLEMVMASNEGPGNFPKDTAVVMVDGVNYAVKPTGYLLYSLNTAPITFHQLSNIITDLNWVTEMMPLTAPLDLGLTIHTVKISIADYQDQFVDSALALSNFKVSTNVVSGGIGANNNFLTGDVVIAGTPKAGNILTITDTLADVDGIPPGSKLYQWFKNGGTISGATNDTYTLLPNDVGNNVTVTVKYNDVNGYLKGKTSDAVVILESSPVIAEGATIQVNISEDNSPTSFSLSLNASDADLDILNWSIDTGATNGNLSLSGTGNSREVNYSPNSNYNGVDSFVIKVDDGNGNSDSILVNVSITAVNDAPVISGSPNSTVNQDVSYSFSPSSFDVDSGSLTFSINNNPSWASFNNQTGVLSGLPLAEHIGVYSNIVISISDGLLTDTLPSFSIEVLKVNKAPVVSPISVVLDEDSSSQISLLASDPNGDPITFIIVQQPSLGTLELQGAVVTYTPFENSSGNDSFLYKATDGTLSSNSAQVSITINSVNDNPIISGIPLTTINQDAQYSFTPKATDVDSDNNSLTFSISNKPNWAEFDNKSGALTGSPLVEHIGEYSNIIISVSDGSLTDDLSAFTITVLKVNQAPIVDDLSITLAEDTSVGIELTAQDANDDFVTISIVSMPSKGSLIAQGAVWLYTPFDDEQGDDSFTYKANDGEVDSAPATVFISITSVNDAPIAIDDVFTLNPTQNNRYLLDVLSNDIDADLDTLTVISVQADIGDATIEEGMVVYQAPQGQLSYVQLTYQIEDEQQVRDSAKIVLNIEHETDNTLPRFTVMNNIVTNANAIFSTVNFGEIEAVDQFDKVIKIALMNSNILLASGKQVTYWQATDNEGNVVIKEQLINVAPLVSIEKDKVVVEGDEYRVKVFLNGLAPEYPVRINYQVSGDVDENDHNLTSGELLIEQGTQGEITFFVYDDSIEEDNESLIISLSSEHNLGSNNVHHLTIVDYSDAEQLSPINEAAKVSVEQNNNTESNDLLITEQYACNVLISSPLTLNSYLLETEPGMCISQNTSLSPNENRGALVLSSTDISPDGEVENVGGLFDFVVDLSTASPVKKLINSEQQIAVVLPQQLPIPNDAILRVYAQTQWQNFAGNDSEKISSSLGTKGYCPPPKSEQWTAGLTQGHWCVQVEVTEGGVNDSDQTQNQQLNLIVGVGVTMSENDAPILVEDNAKVSHLNQVVIDVLANDSDENNDELVIISATVDFGTVEVVDNKLLYITANNYYQTAVITYSVSDHNGGVAYSTTTVNMVDNFAPIVENEQRETTNETYLDINVLANDSDADGDRLTVKSASAEYGQVRINSNQTLTYTPLADFVGTDTIIYIIEDEKSATAQGQVIVTVTDVPENSGGAINSTWLLLLSLLLLGRFKTRVFYY